MAKPRIECIAARDIEAFARREAEVRSDGAVVPISNSRARAWAANPHAKPDDVVLIVARVDGRCAGYLGLLPGHVRVGSRVEPVNWLSTLFVPEALRSQAIGGLLLMRAISLGRSLAAIGSSDEAEATYRAIGFAPPLEVAYFELDLLRRLNWPGLPLRALRLGLQRSGRAVPRPLDVAVDACAEIAGRLMLPTLQVLAERKLGRWRAQPLERLPEGAGAQGSGAYCVRDRELLEWMLAHPWVSTSRAGEPQGYFFDDFREESFHRAYEVRAVASQAPLGWVVLWFDAQGGRRRLHVLDHGLEPAHAGAALVVVALAEARRQRANLVFLPEVCGAALRELGWAAGGFRAARRRSFYRPHPSSELRGALAELRLHYADGDIGFA
jgi:GNAT superfamily N-acetyltransferase